VECVNHPEYTRIKNQGDGALDIAGWRLFSPSPPSDESYDLGRLGALDPGEEVWIFIGHLSPAEDPSRGYYQWVVGPDYGLFLLDDGTDPITHPMGNPDDGVQIFDPQGNRRAQANCGGQPVAFPAPPPSAPQPPPGNPNPPPESSFSLPSSDAGSSTGTSQTTSRSSGGGLPLGGGPPSAEGALDPLALALGAVAMAGGALFASLGLRRRR